MEDLIDGVNFEYSDDKSKENNFKQSLRIGHLNHPLTLQECLFLLNHKNHYCKRHKSLKKCMNKKPILNHIYRNCSNPWHCLESKIGYTQNPSSTESKTENNHRTMFEKCIKTSIKNFVFQKNIFLDSNIDIDERVEIIYFSLIQEIDNQNLFKLYLSKIAAESIKDKISNTDYEIGTYIHVSKDLEVEKETFLFKCPFHGWSIGPTPLLLGAPDNLQSRFNLHLYILLTDFFEKYSQSVYTRFHSLEKEIYQLRNNYGEKFFKIMKLWDSFLIGLICDDKEKDIGLLL